MKKPSHFNIDQFKYLKEFMIANPPDFKISDKCCQGAKKDTSHKYISTHELDLNILGLRGAEGGVRATNIKGCFSHYEDKFDVYRPIWWFKDKDKQEYKDYYNLTYSDCYEVYGFNRTGCSCCPFGSNFSSELEIVKQYEPLLYKAVNNIFGKSYEYTRKYKQFKEQMKAQEKQIKGQIKMDGI